MIRYLPHAEEALAKRGIKRDWVAAAIERPDWTDTDPAKPSRTRSYKAIDEIDGRILRVVHWPEDDDIVVLTAYPDRDALKRRAL
ncbi:DUF4258 domain-containing protein [Acidiphilium iwatense]|uniref:DUF4258 domain-containing protein n=1 Tax=Acidiphilium iwatense TaxID=768198 RepID=A0ABS9DYK9_9PROT|nr:DUF4258 domain-containing protein [Acidiphilium iwatense]MCF3947769.1 DUF4258 domain-containing protein [Acidiphilium iwatense]